jgi:hypothetical protein
VRSLTNANRKQVDELAGRVAEAMQQHHAELDDVLSTDFRGAITVTPI